ncbi:Transposon Ty3-G Gag-Pol poly [Paramuricea clavata]|uniref:RNA-directed DNA polymerase n=1 Tax=Paramuricea clavata TaxID=317549 RepID=A0A6S7HVS9_PARCT|nr:Transposon Ty3-G Gag-Pol poly [Paramuricea clavata]
MSLLMTSNDYANKIKTQRRRQYKESESDGSEDDERKTKSVEKKISCKFCGFEHWPDKRKCPAWGKTCNKCKRKNHFAKRCRKSAIYCIESEEEEISVVRIQAMKEKAVFAKILVNDVHVHFQVDCGASTNILLYKYVEKEKISPCDRTLVMWNGTKVKPLGTCVVRVVNLRNQKKYDVKFLIVKDDLTPLLGLKTTEEMRLLMIHKENFISAVFCKKTDVVDKHAEVFNDDLGRLPGIVHLEVDPNHKPVVLPARKIPVSVRDQFKVELQRSERLGVITPVEEPTKNDSTKSSWDWRCIADDILVYGTDEKDHDKNFERLLERCKEKSIKLTKDKLELKCKEVSFHGHLLTNEGLKVDPLRDLTHKESAWCWLEIHEKAWNEVKHLIAMTPVLAYYKPSESLEIQCDSSQTGLGVALMQNGHPIAYASRTLSETERRYAQIEKEMLAIIYAVEKFNDYTFCRKVTIYSDHKPLESILKKPLHRAPKRLQSMMIHLQKYDIEVKYEKGSNMFLADTLSRASVPGDGKSGPEFETINMMKYLPISDERLKGIQRETKSEESLQVLTTVIRQGWPEQKEYLPNVVAPYFNIRDEMSIQDGLVFTGERVVILQAMRSKMLGKVHNSHLGVNGCLNRAQECLYWPGMSNDNKNHVSTCEACREYERSQPKETLCSHEVPNRPWQRVGIDLFELERKHYLITADYFSDFVELDHLKNISSVQVIRKIKSYFARHGIPEQVITDNGPQFVAHDFQIFTKEWDFEHITCSPYHSQANGKAESAVKEAKKILRKSKKAKSDAFLAVLDHRNTPSTSMKSSPAQRLLNRRARTLLPTTAKLLQPQSIDSGTTVEKLAERKRQQAKY